MSRGEQEGRDLRVPGDVGAAIRLGLAEIVKRLAVSTPLSTEQAVEHVEYELDVLRQSFAAHAKVAEGKGGAGV
jgi:hypothetical protein